MEQAAPSVLSAQPHHATLAEYAKYRRVDHAVNQGLVHFVGTVTQCAPDARHGDEIKLLMSQVAGLLAPSPDPGSDNSV
jgi:hypothetical protein